MESSSPICIELHRIAHNIVNHSFMDRKRVCWSKNAKVNYMSDGNGSFFRPWRMNATTRNKQWCMHDCPLAKFGSKINFSVSNKLFNAMKLVRSKGWEVYFCEGIFFCLNAGDLATNLRVQYRVSGVRTSSLSTHSYKYLSSKFFFLHKNIQSFISRWNQLETVEIIIIYFSSWIIVCFFSFSFSPSLFVIALKLIYIRAKLSADYI